MTAGNAGDGEPAFDWSWADDEGEWVPPAADLSKPSVARMYDYYLGGKDNFAVDREAAEKVAQLIPDLRTLAVANRAFMTRAVEVMAGAGITQFIDLGTGIPTSPNVHEIARQIQPDARVVYVDNDPIVMAHNRALRAVEPGVITVPHDLQQPASVLEDPKVLELIDFSQPVGLLMIAVLHFVRRDIAPEILAQYRKPLAPGSHLAITAVTSEGLERATIEKLEAIYEGATAPAVYRTSAQIEQLFEGFDLVEPGVADITQWRADGTPGSIRTLCGLGVRA